MRFAPLAFTSALLIGASLPAAAQVTLALSSWVPPTHTLTETQKEWCLEVAKRTGDKVKCNVLPRAVAAPPGTFDAVKNGLADISFTVHGYTPGRFATTQFAEFPFLANTSEAASVAFQRIYAKYPAIAEEHKGVKVLAVFTHGPGMVLNAKRPVTKADDLLGLKWRVGGGMVNEIAKSMGMNVTLKPAPESYELLSTGVMDGTLFPAESVEGFKIDKVIKHATTFPGGLYNTSFVFLMNQAKYDSLPPDVKKVVDDMSGEFAARMIGRGWDKVDRRGLAFRQAAGVQFVKAEGMKDPKKALAEFRAEIGKLEK
jgi:TRAP-type C4-dicarboxylate transport system substrate-binding protein